MSTTAVISLSFFFSTSSGHNNNNKKRGSVGTLTATSCFRGEALLVDPPNTCHLSKNDSTQIIITKYVERKSVFARVPLIYLSRRWCATKLTNEKKKKKRRTRTSIITRSSPLHKEERASSTFFCSITSSALFANMFFSPFRTASCVRCRTCSI